MPYVPKKQHGHVRQHGRAAYRKGCRCEHCRHAEASYRRHCTDSPLSRQLLRHRQKTVRCQPGPNTQLRNRYRLPNYLYQPLTYWRAYNDA